MQSEPLFFESANLSAAWASSFLEVMRRGIAALTPLVVSITDFDDEQLPREHPGIRAVLEKALQRYGGDLTVEAVASTIFPHTFWRPGVPRDVLYGRYRRIVSRLHEDVRNRNGLYF